MLYVRAPNRGLRDLYACYLMAEKEGWPGMVVDHVIIPGTKRVRSLLACYNQFYCYTVLLGEGRGGMGGWGDGGGGGGLHGT
jgi:hypothetical protein